MPTLLDSILHDKTERGAYPYLAYLLSGWFHQDYDLIGENLDELLADYKESVSAEEQERTVKDIRSFLDKFGGDDAELAASLKRIFQPHVAIEGWEGLTTRQWLERVVETLS